MAGVNAVAMQLLCLRRSGKSELRGGEVIASGSVGEVGGEGGRKVC